ncbi:hypothetical protein PIB30_033689 [Stylosanthes scabra]|uniref:Uncharacterized protein n=1 Tax=Stylosanthes scabra TaxID=79078 RepID=A0ABU6WEM9_9FABA|nr:hypothetical protein [Stylosanthes scabra]
MNPKSKRYTGKRRVPHILSESGSGHDSFEEENVVEGDEEIPEQRVHHEEIPEQEIAYDYVSEGFESPVEADEERRPGPDGPGRELQYLNNEPKRLRAKCAIENCPCNMADKEWVTSKLVKRLRSQPKMTPKEAIVHMQQDYRVRLHAKKVERALKAAREIVFGNEAE